MNKTKLLAGAAAIAFALSVSGPASAAIVTATYTATVSSDSHNTYDPINGWQYVENQLVGTPISLAFTFDTNAPSYGNSDGYQTYLYGGGIYGNASPMIGAVVQLGSQTYTFTGSWFGEPYVYSSYGSSQIFDQANQLNQVSIPNGNSDSEIGAYASVYSSNYNPFVTTNLAAPLNHDVQPGDYSYGNFWISSNTYDYDVGYLAYDYQNVSITVSNVTVTSGVPEPATWAMMLIGFAGVGFTLRRRNAARAIA